MRADDPIGLLELPTLVSRILSQLRARTIGDLQSLRPQALLQIPDIDWERIHLIAAIVQEVNVRLEDRKLQRERNELIREMSRFWLERSIGRRRQLHVADPVGILESPSPVSAALRYVGVRTIGELQSLRPQRLLRIPDIDWEKILLIAQCIQKVNEFSAIDSGLNSFETVTTSSVPRADGNSKPLGSPSPVSTGSSVSTVSSFPRQDSGEVLHVDDPIKNLISLTSFGYESLLVSQALRLLGIRTIGDLRELVPQKLQRNPSLNQKRAEQLLGIVEKWRKVQLVQEINQQLSQQKTQIKIPSCERNLQDSSSHPRRGRLLARQETESRDTNERVLANTRAHRLLARQKTESGDTLSAPRSAKLLNPLSLRDLARLLEIKGLQEARAAWMRKKDTASPALEATGMLPDSEDSSKFPTVPLPVSEARSAEAKPNLPAGERNYLKTERSHLESDDLQLLMEEERESAQELEERQSESTELAREAHDVPSQEMGKDLASSEESGLRSGWNVFAAIDPKGGDNSITVAFRAIRKRVKALSPPRALCELRANSADYHWLCTWAWSLKPQTALKWLAGTWQKPGDNVSVALSPVGGCLLLFLAAEVARREAQEGYVWSSVEKKFRPETRRLLFAQGQPRQLCKEAIETAARLLKLRHVFGLEGAQNYYVSIYLQFGFTQKGLSQLPFWLAGHAQTKAIQYLLGSSLSSETFKELWFALRNYRQARITEKRLRQALESSPWVLPEWADELVYRAREKLELGTISSDRTETDDDQPLPFLEPSRLQWDSPAEPQFVTRLINLAALGLSEDRYEVRVGSKGLATLLRQPDETYLLDREALLLPCEIAQPVVALVDSTDTLHTDLQLDLWDPREDVTVYELPSGRRLDAWKDPMSLRKTYALLTSPDLKIDPLPSVWRLISYQNKRLSLLPAGWPPQLQILMDKEVFWTPYVGTGSRPTQTEPAWVRGVQLTSKSSASQVALGDALRLRVVGLSQGVLVDFVRLGTRPLDFEQNGDLVEVKAFRITPEVATSELNFTLGLRRENERVRIRRTIDLDVIGGARLTEEGWELLDPKGELTVQEARVHTYKLFLPRPWKGKQIRELGLLEGSTYSRRLGQKPHPLGTLAGFGAPLVIRGLYNWNENADVLKLASAVVDPGVIQEVECEEGRPLQIHLRLPIEPGSQHQVVCWSGDDRPDIILLERASVSEQTCWQVDYRPSNLSRLIVAIAYAGERLGTWWPANLDEVLNPPVAAPHSPIATAALVRWMHLPILSPSFLPVISAFARHHPAETLAAWLLDEGLPEKLSFAATGEEWLAAVRRVFANWFPEPEQAQAIIKTLSVNDPAQPLRAAARGLMRVDPLLMGRVVYSWFKDIAPSSHGKNLAVVQVRALQRQVAELREDASDSDLRNRQEEILNQIAVVMQVDSNFLERGIVQRAIGTLSGRTLSLLDATNLGVTLAVAPFREYLGLRVLGEMAR